MGKLWQHMSEKQVIARRAKIFDLRQAGWTFREIAAEIYSTFWGPTRIQYNRVRDIYYEEVLRRYGTDPLYDQLRKPMNNTKKRKKPKKKEPFDPWLEG